MTNYSELIVLRDHFIAACKSAGVPAFAGINTPHSVENNYTGEVGRLAEIIFYANVDLTRIANKLCVEK